jgi:coenzyme F420 hydrogenase subunit beta
MKAIETVLHLRHALPRRMKTMIPAHVWRLAAAYGLSPREGELLRPRLLRGGKDADQKR